MKDALLILCLLFVAGCGHMPTTEVKSTAGDDYRDNGQVEDTENKDKD